MNLFKILKQAYIDSKDKSNSSLNIYEYEKGYKQWNILIPKDEWLEKKTFESLNKLWGLGLNKMLVDILVPSFNGHTNQIDLVFINKTGVYVIECKNFTCMLQGNNTDDWIRREFNGKKNKIHNPIKQNLSHIKSLNKLLHYCPNNCFKNIVLLADTCRFIYDNNTELPYETRVINYRELGFTIRELNRNNEIVFDNDNIYRIYNELSQYARYSYADKIRHLQYVQNTKGVN